jgi:hypothetical protein
VLHVNIDILFDNLIKFFLDDCIILLKAQDSLHLLIAHLNCLPHTVTVVFERPNQLFVELLSLN